MIAQNGVGSVTMRALGDRLRVSRAALYRHFPDKNALLVAVAADGFAQLRAYVMDRDPPAERVSLERFKQMGDAYVRFAIENPAHYRLMYGREALTREDYPELREAANALFDDLVELFRTLQAVGKVKRQNPESLAYVGWSAVHGLASLVIERQIRADADIEALTRLTTTTVLDGMRRR
jgi:AcrR family transcriptional regulator